MVVIAQSIILKSAARILSLLFSILYSQKSEEQNIAEYAQFFREINHATRDAFSLWNSDLIGPILLVDPATRKVYSNEANEENIQE